MLRSYYGNSIHIYHTIVQKSLKDTYIPLDGRTHVYQKKAHTLETYISETGHCFNMVSAGDDFYHSQDFFAYGQVAYSKTNVPGQALEINVNFSLFLGHFFVNMSK